jgi:hypothetical protein
MVADMALQSPQIIIICAISPTDGRPTRETDASHLSTLTYHLGPHDTHIVVHGAGNTWNDLITLPFYRSHADITSVPTAMIIHFASSMHTAFGIGFIFLTRASGGRTITPRIFECILFIFCLADH